MDRGNELFTHLHPQPGLISINGNFVSIGRYLANEYFPRIYHEQRIRVDYDHEVYRRMLYARYRRYDFQIPFENSTVAF